jgi:hypothetical protein
MRYNGSSVKRLKSCAVKVVGLPSKTINELLAGRLKTAEGAIE